jgi:hypothetical protein
MSRPRPVIGPHPVTGVPTTWPSAVAAGKAWGRTGACIGLWIKGGRIGWSFAPVEAVPPQPAVVNPHKRGSKPGPRPYRVGLTWAWKRAAHAAGGYTVAMAALAAGALAVMP